MKLAPLAALLLIAGATTPALADGHAETSETAAPMTINTPIQALVADEGAKAVLDKHLPGIESHPAYGQFKGMSLVEVQPWSQGMITDELLEAIAADLAALD